MAFEVLYSVIDGKGKQSTFEIALPSVTSFADVILFAGEMAKLIDPLLGGRISRIGVGFLVDLPGTLAVVAQPTSDVEEGARFQFLTNANHYTGFRAPTFLETYIIAGTEEVNTADAVVAPVLTAMTAGINLTAVGGSGTVQPSDKRDEDITALSFAREMFQSSRGRT